ncbi:hypothetical protein SRRS_00370 [Sporomusa rhizae]|uniref:hypothetical protein n=1 Tax=Sporomusa rhizae TaxID=357999 RepID=UPI00352A8083
MEKYQKYGINPLLISIATGQQLQEVSPRPTAGMLPGTYSKIISKHMQVINDKFPKTITRLTCKRCGKNGDYDFGTLVIPASDAENAKVEGNFQALGYFRCKHCNATGEWELSSRIKTMLAGKIAAAAMRSGVNSAQPEEVIFGEALIDKDFSPRWGSDAEEYFLKKLAQSPEDSYLWNRLGNAYYIGKRPELAAFSHQQALTKYMGQVESHFSLGQLLLECGELEKAAEHFRQAVAFSHQYKKLPAYDLRELIVGALSKLFTIYTQSQAKIDMLPNPNELEMAHFSKSEIAATTNLDFDIDPNRRETLYPIAEVYLGERREELLPAERVTKLPKLKTIWPVAAKVNKQKPPKKNKKRR